MCLLQGIDSDEPVLQLGRNVFSGEYKDTLGTKVLFECNTGVYKVVIPDGVFPFPGIREWTF